MYLDDIIIFSPDVETHLKDLEEVFKRILQNGLHLKASKCSFFKSEIKYLGYLVTASGIMPDPTKVEAIKNIEAPKNVDELRSFLGLTGYYRKFVKNYARVTAPLTQLTWINEPYTWTPEHQTLFNELKQILTSAPILMHPDFNYPFIIQTDACDRGLGAVLCQKINGEERVIEYLSRTLQAGERNGLQEKKRP